LPYDTLNFVTTLVCLGDSFTEGLCDDLRPDGRHLGWADRVAEGLARTHGPVRFANLSVRGKLIDQVITEQLPVARAMHPDIVTFHAGPNDILRPRVDARRVTNAFEASVAGLRSSGSDVVLFTSITRTGGTGRVADRLAARFDNFNDEVRRIADAYCCRLVDNAAIPVLSDRRLWAPDRLHPSPEGHRRIAAHVLHTLGIREPAILGGPIGWWAGALPPASQASTISAVTSDARWIWTHVLPWVGRRVRGVSSGDGIEPKDPQLRTVEVVVSR